MPNSKRSSAGNDARATSNKRRQTRSTAATQETHSGSGGGSGVGSGVGSGAQSIQFAKTAPVMPHGKLPDHLLAYVSNSTVSFDAYSLNFGSVPS